MPEPSNFANLKESPALKHVGGLLKSAREAQNLSLQDIVERTRINRNILNQIEEGYMGEQPGPVFLRGFLRSYAQVVMLDPEEIIQKSGIAPEEIEADKPLHFNQLPEIPSQSTSKRLWKVLITLSILGGGAYGGFIFLTNPAQNQEKPQVQNPVVQSVNVETPRQDQTPEVEKVQNLPNEKTVVESQIHSIAIESRKTVWVRVQIDAEPPFETRMLPGQQLNIQSQEGVKLTAGDSSAIRVFFDGEPVVYEGGNDLVVDWAISTKNQ